MGGSGTGGGDVLITGASAMEREKRHVRAASILTAFVTTVILLMIFGLLLTYDVIRFT